MYAMHVPVQEGNMALLCASQKAIKPPTRLECYPGWRMFRGLANKAHNGSKDSVWDRRSFWLVI